MKVTKNGKDVFEIDDAEDSVEAARSKGYRPIMTVTKNGIDTFDLDSEDMDSVKAAFDKGYMDVSAYKNLQESKKTSTPRSKLNSFGHGVAQGMTLGFGDEIAGGLEAGMDSLIADDDKSFGDRYKESRDKYRDADHQAQKANPLTYFGGNLAGGAFVPGAAGIKGASIASSVLRGAAAGAAQGAVSGAGSSEEEDLGGIAGDAAWGSIVGAGTGGIVGGVTNVVGRSLSKAGRQSLSDEVAAAKRGWKESTADSVLDLGGWGRPAVKTWNAVKETMKSDAAQKEFRALLNTAKNDMAKSIVSKVTNNPPESELRAARSMLDKMSDDEFILRSLMEDGDNAVKQWVARNAGSLEGGQINADEYNKILNLGTSERINARDFDARKAADELLPHSDAVVEGVPTASKQGYNRYMAQAGKSFDGANNEIQGLAGKFATALKDSASEATISPKTTTRIETALNRVVNGKGPSHLGLKEGYYLDVDNPERFMRLQKARELLDEGIDYKALEHRAMTSEERILASLRDDVDSVLKADPSKQKADEIYRNMMGIEENVLGKISLGGKADKYKIARMLNDTDQSNRFRDDLSRLRDFTNDTRLDPKIRQQVKEYLSAFDKAADTADLKRQINAFRNRQGPTSPAIERLGSQINKNSLVQDSVRNPSSFLNSADQFIKMNAQELTGKSFKDLGEPEKNALIKLWVWAKSSGNEGQFPTPDSMKQNYQIFLKKSK